MFEKVNEYLSNHPWLRDKLVVSLAATRRYGLVVLQAYLLAAVCSAYFANATSSKVAKTIRPLAAPGAQRAGLTLLKRSTVNHHDIKKIIMERNLFNSEGKFPDERVVENEVEKKQDSFDIDGPCKDTALNISLIGTIFNGTRFNSFAVIREKGYSQSDVYGVGDVIIGEEQASIVAVDPQSVILNNAGVKECMQLEQPKGGDLAYDNVESPTPIKPGEAIKRAEGQVQIALAEVERAAGSGGEGLLSSGRIVPVNDPETNQMLGFKLISVKAGGLFSKIGLSNGDIITAVNDTSLKEPDKGFQFYQAFEDETDIRISFLRNGKQPTTISVTIK